MSKATAARMLGISTVTLDRWSRPFNPNGGWPHEPVITRYAANGGYPYTLFKRSDIADLKRSSAHAK